jgi:hypothetical protein
MVKPRSKVLMRRTSHRCGWALAFPASRGDEENLPNPIVKEIPEGVSVLNG